MWLDRVKRHYGDGLEIEWKNFQLEQVNSKEEAEWKVWELADERDARSLVAAVAGEAARRQGVEAFERFHLGLLTARHGGEGRVPLNESEAVARVAEEAGLDVERFKKDLRDRSLLDVIARDHTEAAEEHGVFGTPTFVFEDGSASYLKTFIPPEDDSVAFFEHFVALASHRSYIGEIKRPQPPWPKGAV